MVYYARMEAFRRVTIFAGHYGSGKTNIALNYARALARTGLRTCIADLDIVNPYFRTKDSAEALAAEGIGLVVSPFANSNVDFPALPKEIYALVADRSTHVVMDVGGDDRGALALGRYTPYILAENDYDMLFVVNFFRPLTADPPAALGVMREIEAAAGMSFTGIVNNSNLGEETEARHVLGSVEKAGALSELSGLPVRMTTVRRELERELTSVENLFPVTLQKYYYHIKEKP